MRNDFIHLNTMYNAILNFIAARIFFAEESLLNLNLTRVELYSFGETVRVQYLFQFQVISILFLLKEILQIIKVHRF